MKHPKRKQKILMEPKEEDGDMGSFKMRREKKEFRVEVNRIVSEKNNMLTAKSKSLHFHVTFHDNNFFVFKKVDPLPPFFLVKV